MSTVLEMPLRDLVPTAVQDLQNRFPSATLRIEMIPINKVKGMNETRFWKIINQFDWKTTDTDKILAPAIKVLSQCSVNDIKKFHDILHQKLYSLDAQRFAEQLGSNRYAENMPFSVDSFLYARCCVVANGENFYQTVLFTPSKMPKEYTFEALLYLPKEAYTSKTGKDNYNHFPETWCETFSNIEGWNSAMSLQDKILKLL